MVGTAVLFAVEIFVAVILCKRSVMVKFAMEWESLTHNSLQKSKHNK